MGLTRRGFEQHHSLGAFLRRRYVREAGFLPVAYHEKNSNLFLRSTSFERTIESLQGLLTGLYPHTERAHGTAGQFVIHTRAHEQENLVWNPMTCPRMRGIEKEWRSSPQGQEVYKKLEELLGDSHYSEVTWHELFSTLESLYVSGHELPPGIDESHFGLIRHYTNVEAQHWPGSAEAAKLSLGNWLHELLHLWNSRKPNNRHMQIFSAHDHTIVPLLRIFGLDVWHPNMASCLIMELYREEETRKRFIHILLNGEEQNLPLKSHHGRHFFDYDDFCKLVEPYLVSSRDEYFRLCGGTDRYAGHHPPPPSEEKHQHHHDNHRHGKHHK